MSGKHLIEKELALKEVNRQFIEFQASLPSAAKCAYCNYPLRSKRKRQGAKYCDIHCYHAMLRKQKEQAQT